MRATLLDYAQRFPQIEIGMIESPRKRLVTALHNGAIDIAIVTGETPLLDCKAVSLWSELVVVALPDSHRLATSETIYWTDLSGETLLISQHDPGSEIHDLLMAKFAPLEDRPKVVCHDVSPGNIKSLVGAGFGVSLATESCIGANVSGLVYREARDDAGQIRIGYSAHWREDNDNPALASFLKLLEERYPLRVDAV
jgi:DNA-binding transcriptional LysR family regulator